ncbi:hypothetical protein A4X06_0g3998 [Tilletia controversa]|uniref:FHA domain-containing protein n=1 Tax=Tilletia controversa TaxID=13291 RepID=A0A8X7MUB1_9BASI|nr:hypothetical protein A4X06_0g3998 [Tilletia controversa]
MIYQLSTTPLSPTFPPKTFFFHPDDHSFISVGGAHNTNPLPSAENGIIPAPIPPQIAEITFSAGVFTIRDISTSHTRPGTLLNGDTLRLTTAQDHETPLADGDELSFGFFDSPHPEASHYQLDPHDFIAGVWCKVVIRRLPLSRLPSSVMFAFSPLADNDTPASDTTSVSTSVLPPQPSTPLFAAASLSTLTDISASSLPSTEQHDSQSHGTHSASASTYDSTPTPLASTTSASPSSSTSCATTSQLRSTGDGVSFSYAEFIRSASLAAAMQHESTSSRHSPVSTPPITAALSPDVPHFHRRDHATQTDPPQSESPGVKNASVAVQRMQLGWIHARRAVLATSFVLAPQFPTHGVPFAPSLRPPPAAVARSSLPDHSASVSASASSSSATTTGPWNRQCFFFINKKQRVGRALIVARSKIPGAITAARFDLFPHLPAVVTPRPSSGIRPHTSTSSSDGRDYSTTVFKNNAFTPHVNRIWVIDNLLHNSSSIVGNAAKLIHLLDSRLFLSSTFQLPLAQEIIHS